MKPALSNRTASTYSAYPASTASPGFPGLLLSIKSLQPKFSVSSARLSRLKNNKLRCVESVTDSHLAISTPNCSDWEDLYFFVARFDLSTERKRLVGLVMSGALRGALRTGALGGSFVFGGTRHP